MLKILIGTQNGKGGVIMSEYKAILDRLQAIDPNGNWNTVDEWDELPSESYARQTLSEWESSEFEPIITDIE